MRATDNVAIRADLPPCTPHSRWLGSFGAMQRGSEWIDLLDPTEAELREAWPTDVHPQAIETLLTA